MNKGLSIIIWFSFIATFIFFTNVFIFEIGDEYVLTPLDDLVTNVSPILGISAPMESHIHGLPEEYRALNIPYDLAFVISFIVVFFTSILTSYKAPEISWLSFFGKVTIGFMIFLFVTGFIITMKDWLVLNLIENVLGFELSTTPIFFYYLNNIGFINFMWFIVILLVNKLNLTNIRESNESNINIPGGNV